jgi:Spy/CpxP family protein refolding chaperone
MAADANDQTDSDAARRAEALQRIEMVRLYRLVEILDLDSDQAARMFPVFQQYDRQFRELIERKEQTYDALRRELGAAQPDARKLTAMSDQIVAFEQEAMRIRDAQYNELKKMLSPAQCAKYLLFEKRFNKEINRILEDVRGKRKGSSKASK